MYVTLRTPGSASHRVELTTSTGSAFAIPAGVAAIHAYVSFGGGSGSILRESGLFF